MVWDCGQEFKNLIADAEFNLVASRSAQAAVLKAIKNGESVVDLNAKTEGTDPDGGGNGGGSGTGNNPSNGSNTSNPTNRQYTLSVTSANTAQGTVTGGTYSEGSRVNVTATPKSGFQFDKWSDGNTSASRTINVTQNLSLTASFIVSTGSGTGTNQTGGGTTGSGDDEEIDAPVL